MDGQIVVNLKSSVTELVFGFGIWPGAVDKLLRPGERNSWALQAADSDFVIALLF